MFFRSSLGRPSATPKHWNTTRWASQTGCVWEKHECARCDGEANRSGCIILPFLWVTAPKPSLRQSSERCFSELIQPSDKRWHTLRINHFIYLSDVSYLFRLSQFARTSESKETGSLSTSVFFPSPNQHEGMSLGHAAKRKRALTTVLLHMDIHRNHLLWQTCHRRETDNSQCIVHFDI